VRLPVRHRHKLHQNMLTTTTLLVQRCRLCLRLWLLGLAGLVLRQQLHRLGVCRRAWSLCDST
jgi:hypothetical protein